MGPQNRRARSRAGSGAAHLRELIAPHRALLSNSTSLIATTLVTSLLGLAYWAAAARLFRADTVGFGAAAVSAMTLLGTVGMLGLGTLLIGELAHRASGGRLVTTALLVSVVASSVLGLGFILIGSVAAPGSTPYTDGLWPAAVFITGVALTAVGFVLDQAMIGLLWGRVQLWRNIVFSASKLLIIIVAAPVLDDRFGVGVLFAWVAGTALSLAVTAGTLARRARVIHLPDWSLARRLGRSASAHNWLNLAFQAPRLALPILVASLISAEVNASFFAAWMIATLLYVVPTHLSTVLFAVGTGNPAGFAAATRFSFKGSLLFGVAAVPIAIVSAEHLLALFGVSYSAEATVPLQILAIGYFPTVVKVHYVAVGRVSDRLSEAARWLTLGATLEIGVAIAVCVTTSNLVALSVALVTVMFIEAAVTAGPVLRIIRRSPRGASDTADHAAAI